MDSLDRLKEHVETAVKEGAAADGLGDVATWIERFGNSENVSVFAFGDGFEAMTSGGRHMRIRHWLKDRLPPEEARKVVTILALTYAEAEGTPDRLPASGAILDLHATDE